MAKRKQPKIIDEGVNLLTHVSATRRRDELVKRAERLFEDRINDGGAVPSR